MTTKVKPSVLADTSVSAGTYGGTANVAVFTVDSQGRLTHAANVAPASSEATSISSGNWSITPSGTKINFSYSGNVVFSIDSSGNIISKADITGFGTP